MKQLILPAVICLMLAACGAESSPEGRMGIKIDNLQKAIDKVAGMQQQIDSLKTQNTIILDSLGKLNSKIAGLKGN